MVHILHDLMLVTLPTIVAYFTGREMLRAELRIRKQRKQLRDLRKQRELRKQIPPSHTELQERYRVLGGRIKLEVTSSDQFRAGGYGALRGYLKPKTPKGLWQDKQLERAAKDGIFNAFEEPEIPGVTVASTGCELTDAIFGAANAAGIVPQEFFDELDSEDITARCRDLSDAPSDTRTVFQSAYPHRESQTP